jgi:hypothetical protein
MKPIVKAIWIDFESEAFMHLGEALETDTKMMCVRKFRQFLLNDARSASILKCD